MDEPPSKKWKQTQITFFSRTPASAATAAETCSSTTDVGVSVDKETAESRSGVITAALSVQPADDGSLNC